MVAWTQVRTEPRCNAWICASERELETQEVSVHKVASEKGSSGAAQWVTEMLQLGQTVVCKGDGAVGYTDWTLTTNDEVDLWHTQFSITSLKMRKTCQRFDRDKLVFFKAKISWNGNASFLWPYTASFTVTGVSWSLWDSRETPVTVNDAVYGHKNDVFPFCDIFALKKTGASRSKCWHVSHILRLVIQNCICHMLRPAEKLPLHSK